MRETAGGFDPHPLLYFSRKGLAPGTRKIRILIGRPARLPQVAHFSNQTPQAPRPFHFRGIFELIFTPDRCFEVICGESGESGFDSEHCLGKYLIGGLVIIIRSFTCSYFLKNMATIPSLECRNHSANANTLPRLSDYGAF